MSDARHNKVICLGTKQMQLIVMCRQKSRNERVVRALGPARRSDPTVPWVLISIRVYLGSISGENKKKIIAKLTFLFFNYATFNSFLSTYC